MPVFDPAVFDDNVFDTGGGGTTVTASDSPTTSDNAARVLALLRTTTDAPSVAGTASRIATLARSAVDAPSFSDAATASLITIRTAADAPSVAGTASRIAALTRTATGTTTTSDAAAVIQTLVRTSTDTPAIDEGATRYLSLASPIVSSPEPAVRYSIVVHVDGVDITDDVVIEEASFITMVNGQPGSCLIKVRDPNRDKSFTVGSRITLDIAGNRVWTGYLTAQRRTYAFSFYNPATRLLTLEGTDINILFHKRFVEYQTTPTRMLGPIYSAATSDLAAIHDLIHGWLDLSGDDLNTLAYVESVGNVNVDQKANLWQAGWDWGSAMSTIARLTQAIFYIDPNRHLVYTDVDSPSAPYVMSDTPSGGQTGYRELEISHDGANLVNDALVWGYGGGSASAVFDRLQDATSETAHGRWQSGATYAGAWKQATVNKIADSLVNGSPLSKRGAKNDRVSVILTTFTPGFLPAQKVDFHSNAFGFSDVLPIRRMEVTFPGGNPRYRLTLSHEIDQPFSLIDVIPIDPINLDLPPITGIGDPPHITIEIPGDCDCGMTDTFTRVVSNGWGTSDAGIVWAGGNPADDPKFSVAGGHGVYISNASSIPALILSNITLPPIWTMEMRFLIGSPPTNFLHSILHELRLSNGRELEINLAIDNSHGYIQLDFDPSAKQTINFTSGGWFIVKWYYDNITGTARGKCWHEVDPEPDWQIELIFGSGDGIANSFRANWHATPNDGTWNYTHTVDYIDITDFNKCSEFRFDNFNRTVASGWGTSSDGHVWAQESSSGTVAASVNGSQGVVSFSSGGFMDLVAPTPMSTAETFVMTTLVNGWTAAIQAVQFVADNDVGDWLHYVNIVNSTTDCTVVIRDGSHFDSVVLDDPLVGTYYVKWERDVETVIARAKVWRADAPEPDWNVIVALNGSPPLDSLVVSTTNVTKRFEFIDFDYDDKPCFDDATDETTFDTFDRTTASANDSNETSSTSVGTPSSGDENYSKNEFDTGDTIGYVDGEFIWEEAADFTHSMSLNLWFPQDQMNASAHSAVLALLNDPCVFSLRFRPRVVLDFDNGATTGRNKFKFRLNGDDATFAIEVAVSDGNGASDSTGGMTIDTTGNDYLFLPDGESFDPDAVTLVKTDWFANVWYTLKFDWHPDTHVRVKLWNDSEAEPDWQLSGYKDSFEVWEPLGGIALEGSITLGADVPFEAGFRFDDLIAVETAIAPAIGSTTGEPGIRTCEAFTGDSSTVLFTTQGAYVAGSLEVYLNGARQTPGIDYSETTPAEGTFTMTIAPGSSDNFYVCYHYLTLGGGGGGRPPLML